MRLQPGSCGARMLGDAVPHALSLLQVLAPDPDPWLEDLAFSTTDPDARRVTLRFGYRTASAAVQARVELEQAHALPREAELVIDGARARRLVARNGYRISFADDARSVPVADPLGLLVSDFVSELREGSGETRDSREIVVRMQLLEAIVRAHASQTGKARSREPA